MNKRNFTIIIALLILSLVSILFVQFNWISDLNRLNEDRFKFEETTGNMEILKNTINNILSNYDQEFEHYLPYLLKVKNGKNIFEKQAIKIFNKKV